MHINHLQGITLYHNIGLLKQQIIERMKYPLYLEYNLTEIDITKLIKLVINNQSNFKEAAVIEYPNGQRTEVVDKKYRSCLMSNSPDFKPFIKQIETFLLQNKDTICNRLGIKNFNWGRMESTCTAYGNGAHFHKHTDIVKDGRAGRKLTWVYYFNLEPKQFTGGALTIFGKAGEASKIEADCGRLVIFPSNVLHEVERVSLPNNDFSAHRFALTGFINKESSTYFKLKYKIKVKAKSLLGDKFYELIKKKVNTTRGLNT